MQEEIGDYHLQEEIGQGSMGTTYLALHRYLKRPFIVKLLPPELSANAAFMERFDRRVPLLATLEHPHIAKIHNAFVQQGQVGLVSEPVSQPLSLREVTLSEEEILCLARQVAGALDYGHAEGVAHGALTLSNVLVQRVEGGINAFLTDFGLSSIMGPLEMLSRMYHHVVSVLEKGSFSLSERLSPLQYSFTERFFFLAPEEKKETAAPSQGADGYALGVLIYFLLTETFPEGRFPLPSELRSDLHYSWDGWISRLLHPDPLYRPLLLVESLEEEVGQRAMHQLKELRSRAESLVGATPRLKTPEITRPTFDADPAAVFQIDTAIVAYRPKAQEEREIEPQMTEMVVIPGGSYFRGSNHGGRDEMPRHQVQLLPFAIDIHPVTNEQFVLFLEAMGGEKDVNNSDIIRLKDARIKRSAGALHIESGYARHPVVGVTWYGAVAYSKWVGKRLPTEAEWETAACGGREESVYPTGGQIEKSEANFFSSDTTPVMSYPSQPSGLFDMAGNVYEWCQDWYDYHYYDLSAQEPSYPKGPSQGVYRVLRGGCWKSSKEDLRCAHRHRNNPGSMNGTYGFRCAADVS